MSMYYNAGPEIFKRAKELRENETEAEKSLWKYLSANKLGVKFRRQHPIKWFIADFYCHEAHLIIEVDGDVHNDKLQKEYDTGRTVELESMGLKVLRFSNDELETDIELVINQIREAISNSRTVPL